MESSHFLILFYLKLDGGDTEMIQCKLCGTIIKSPEDLEEHRRNHHSWYDGESITKETPKW